MGIQRIVSRRRATLGDSPEKVHNDLVVLVDRFRAIALKVNGRKCKLTILNDSVAQANGAVFRGLLTGVRVVEERDF